MVIDSTVVSGPVSRGFFGTPSETGCTPVCNPHLQTPYPPGNAWQNPRKLHAEGF